MQFDEIIPHLPQMGKSKLFFFVCVLGGGNFERCLRTHIWNCTFFLFWCSLCRHLGICTAEFSAYLTFGLNQLFFLNDDRSRKVDPQLHEKKKSNSIEKHHGKYQGKSKRGEAQLDICIHVNINLHTQVQFLFFDWLLIFLR